MVSLNDYSKSFDYIESSLVTLAVTDLWIIFVTGFKGVAKALPFTDFPAWFWRSWALSFMTFSPGRLEEVTYLKEEMRLGFLPYTYLSETPFTSNTEESPFVGDIMYGSSASEAAVSFILIKLFVYLSTEPIRFFLPFWAADLARTAFYECVAVKYSSRIFVYLLSFGPLDDVTIYLWFDCDLFCN